MVYLLGETSGVLVLRPEFADNTVSFNLIGNFSKENMRYQNMLWLDDNCMLIQTSTTNPNVKFLKVLKGMGQSFIPEKNQSIPSPEINVGQLYNFTLLPDNVNTFFKNIAPLCDILTAQIDGPNWLKCQPDDCNPNINNTLTIYGTPQINGTYPIELTLCNGAGCQSNNFTITVFPLPENVSTVSTATIYSFTTQQTSTIDTLSTVKTATLDTLNTFFSSSETSANHNSSESSSSGFSWDIFLKVLSVVIPSIGAIAGLGVCYFNWKRHRRGQEHASLVTNTTTFSLYSEPKDNRRQTQGLLNGDDQDSLLGEKKKRCAIM